MFRQSRPWLWLLLFSLLFTALVIWNLNATSVSPWTGHVAMALAEPRADEVWTEVLQQGHEGYTGAVDTFLRSWYPETNYQHVDPLVVRADGAAVALLRFDLAPVPAYAAINSARLELYASSRGGPTAPFTLQAYQVLRPWNVAQATWLRATAAAPWALPGCEGVGADRQGASAGATSVGDVGQWYALDLTALAQAWLDDPASNHGILLKGASPQAVEYRFFSAEHWWVEQRPKLVIQYYDTAP